MLTTETIDPKATESSSPQVMLANGNWRDLTGLSRNQLEQLQWEQEQHFARAIAAVPARSRERALVTGQAYDTICTILAAQQADRQPLVMGLDERYVRLVLDLLYRQVHQGIGRPRLFEVGYGSGALLHTISEHGFPIGGVEISAAMRKQAIRSVTSADADDLLLGDLRDVPLPEYADRPSLVYWNDVFEHICPDEISNYLKHIYELLLPGGALVTITPNWLLRPSDVTRIFCPLRTEARGLHLKEYRLSEVTRLLTQTGFRRVATPLFVSRKRIHLAGGGLRFVKQLIEPLLDRLPVKYTHLLCRGLGLSYTIATK